MKILFLIFCVFINFLVTGILQSPFASAGSTSSGGDVSISGIVPEATTSAILDSDNGGNLVLVNDNNTDAVLTFPADFQSEDLRVQANSYPDTFFETTKPAPSGKDFVGKTYDFNLFTASGSNEVFIVTAPVTVTVSYLAADFNGVDENSIAPYRWGNGNTAWQPIQGFMLNTRDNIVTFPTINFSSFALFGTLSTTPTPAPSDGGGAFPSYSTPRPITSVTFSGRAYPKSTVTLLKDAQVAATTIAGADANFQISISGLSRGNYFFSVYSEDSRGIRSSLLTFPVSVTAGATTHVSDIFIAPTLAVDKSEIKRGENIAIFGQSTPEAEITIQINSEQEFFVKMLADAYGIFLYNFDTTPLDIGAHLAKSKAAINGEISSFSSSVDFAVGTKSVQTGLKVYSKGDLNSDGHVNLVDFSIGAYWYKRPFSDAFTKIEFEGLNGDKKIDLTDFSIMAYYWTG